MVANSNLVRESFYSPGKEMKIDDTYNIRKKVRIIYQFMKFVKFEDKNIKYKSIEETEILDSEDPSIKQRKTIKLSF